MLQHGFCLSVCRAEGVSMCASVCVSACATRRQFHFIKCMYFALVLLIARNVCLMLVVFHSNSIPDSSAFTAHSSFFAVRLCSLFTIVYVYEYRRYCLCAFAWNTPNRIILLPCQAMQRCFINESPLHTFLWFCAQVDISIYEYMLKSTNFPSANKCMCGKERPKRMCAWHLPDIRSSIYDCRRALQSKRRRTAMHRMRSNCAPDFDHLDNSFHQSNDDANEHLHIYTVAKCTQSLQTHTHTCSHTRTILFELHLGSANIDTDTAQHSGFMLSTQKVASHVTHRPWPTMQIQCNFGAEWTVHTFQQCNGT